MPPPLPSSSPEAVPGPQAPDVLQADLRTTQGIVWSCLATIFACTWVAMHPNLPNPQDTKWTQWKKRVGIMALALLAPEFILLWAMKQRIAAGIIAKEYNRIILSMHQPSQRCSRQEDCLRHTRSVPGPQKWTVVHGFFIQMGGLMLVDADTDCPYRVLNFPLLRDLIQSGKVVPVEISEEEICDKSKGDFLTKLIVIIQTSWFVVQCLARWALKLPVTELEVMTFSFALLNIITYSILWKKPQNIAIPMKVPRKVFLDEEADITNAPPPYRYDPAEPEETPPNHEPGLRKFGKVTVIFLQSFMLTILRVTILRGLEDVIWGARGYNGSPEPPAPSQLTTLQLSTSIETSTDSTVFHGELAPFNGEQAYTHHDGPWPTTSPSGPYGVASFYAGEIVSIMYAGGLLVFGITTGALFGGLHLIPWKVEFPTRIESIIWRVSALCITVCPVLVSLRLALSCIRRPGILSRVLRSPAIHFFSRRWTLWMVAIATNIATLLYIASRLSLILLSFTTLRSLNPDFYREIPWNSYIPHF